MNNDLKNKNNPKTINSSEELSMFLTAEEEEAKTIKSMISLDVLRFKSAGLSEPEATSKALAKNDDAIKLYKKQADKAYRTIVYTTLDNANFYTAMQKPFAWHFKKLQPIYSNARSFYGKARTIDSGEVINLISYDSCVLSYNRRKNVLLQNSLTKCSATTRRHVDEFLSQLFGVDGGLIVYNKLD